jgi:hypothetical protein
VRRSRFKAPSPGEIQGVEAGSMDAEQLRHRSRIL